MIVVAIIALSTIVLGALFTLFESMPVIPDTFVGTITTVMPYIVRGVKFINGFIYPEIVWPLATVCVGLHTFYVGYRVYMWVVKKIPMLGVSD